MKSIAAPFIQKLLPALLGLSLSAAASAGALDVFPDWIDFGQIPVGSSTSRSVNIRNNTNEYIYSISLNQFGDSQEFRVNSWGCYSLGPFQSCSVDVEYAPQEVGYHRLNIDIWSSSTSSRIDITGQSYDPNPNQPPVVAAPAKN